MNHKKWEYFQIVSLGLLSCLSTTVYAIACTDCFDDAQYSKYSCIQGTLGNDFSLEGDVYFEGENDRICAGNGHDIVRGLFGNDLISGGDGNDTINGNAGNDFINGNIGSDIVHGGQDDDVIRGGKDNDFMYGDLGNDIIYGDEGDDELFDLEGNDIYVYRHNGNITENFHSNGDGCDEILDDAGNDTLWFQDISNLENIKYEESYSNLFLYRRDNRQPIIWIHNHSSTGNIENIRLGTTVTQQTYALTAYLLEVNTFGNGTVTSPIYAEEDSNYNCKFGSGTVNWSESGINCDSDCSESYINGSTVTLTAHPESFATFEGWSGCTSTDGTLCTVFMNSAQNVTATFNTIEQQVLHINKTGTGTGTVSSTPSGILCGNECEQFFDDGSNVTLTANPDTDSIFVGWSGACSGHECLVSMTETQTVTAQFNSKCDPVITLTGDGLYQVADTVHVNLTADIEMQQFQQVDLYVIIEMPDKTFWYLTNQLIKPFSLEVTPFLRSMQYSDENISILTFMVPPGYGGSYSFYAFFNDEGTDFSSLFKTLSSNVAKTTVILADQ